MRSTRLLFTRVRIPLVADADVARVCAESAYLTRDPAQLLPRRLVPLPSDAVASADHIAAGEGGVTVERLLTTQEVADLLRTTASTVRYWRHVGTGPRGFRAGRRVLYAEADVEAWVARKRAAEQAHDRTLGAA